MQLSNKEQTQLAGENTTSGVDQGVAAGQKRIDDANEGKRFFHAWIPQREIHNTATTSVKVPPLNRIGMDTLHESIIAYQNGERLLGKGGYENLRQVSVDISPITDKETKFDFAIRGTEPVFITYLLANLADRGDKKEEQEIVESLNVGFFKDFVAHVTKDPQFTIEGLKDVAKAVAVGIEAVASLGKSLLDPASIRTLVDGVLALRNIVIPNQDGPLVYGMICIEDPKNLLPSEEHTDLSRFQAIDVRCKKYTGDSDYAARFEVKPMNNQDRKDAGIA